MSNCERCAAERARAEAILVDLQNAETELRAVRRQLRAAKAENSKIRESSPDAVVVKRLLEFWRVETNHPKAAVPLDGARAAAVRRMLKVFGSEKGPRRIAVAIRGAKEKPFVGPRGRQSTSSGGAKRHDDITLICRDEATLERFESYAPPALRVGEQGQMGAAA